LLFVEGHLHNTCPEELLGEEVLGQLLVGSDLLVGVILVLEKGRRIDETLELGSQGFVKPVKVDPFVCRKILEHGDDDLGLLVLLDLLFHIIKNLEEGCVCPLKKNDDLVEVDVPETAGVNQKLVVDGEFQEEIEVIHLFYKDEILQDFGIVVFPDFVVLEQRNFVVIDEGEELQEICCDVLFVVEDLEILRLINIEIIRMRHKAKSSYVVCFFMVSQHKKSPISYIENR
jgi:hypothetical protein